MANKYTSTVIRIYDENTGELLQKSCSKCGKVKDVSEFGKCKSSSNGFQNYCRECRKVINKKRNEENPEYQKGRYENNKKAKSKQWKQKLNNMSDGEVNQHLLKHMLRVTKRDKVLIKRCSGCMEYKLSIEFIKNRRKKDGLQYECKECQTSYKRKHYQDNRDFYRNRNKINKEKKLKENPNYYRDYRRKRYQEPEVKELHSKRAKRYHEKLKNRTNIEIQKYKKCPTCGIIKPSSEFGINKGNKSGLQGICNDCRKQYRNNLIQQALGDIRIIVEANPTKYDYIPGTEIYGIIYYVHNKITDRYYVGQTTRSFDLRYSDGFFHNHIDKNEDRDRKPNEILQQDLELYGEESFEFNKLFKVASNKYELDKIEAYYIDHFNSYEAGYNRTRGNWFTSRGLEE